MNDMKVWDHPMMRRRSQDIYEDLYGIWRVVGGSPGSDKWHKRYGGSPHEEGPEKQHVDLVDGIWGTRKW